MDASRLLSFTGIATDGARTDAERRVVIERPMAVEIGSVGYVMMMATPADLADFAHGFARSERLIDGPADIVDVAVEDADAGVILRLTLAAGCMDRVAERVRRRRSASLGDSLEPLRAVTNRSDAEHGAIFAALGALPDHQPLARATGAVHAAALCGADGAIRLVREDVGCATALDKLLGAMARAGTGWDGGFALLTARCTYELVEKAVLADCPLLVAIAAPTSLAVERAREAGLRLIAPARPDIVLEA
jgi:FdhD protein